jgi:hypothetical protein
MAWISWSHVLKAWSSMFRGELMGNDWIMKAQMSVHNLIGYW